MIICKFQRDWSRKPGHRGRSEFHGEQGSWVSLMVHSRGLGGGQNGSHQCPWGWPTVPLPFALPPGPCSLQRLLNWMLALACQRGHLGLVKLLVLTYGADPESYAVRKNEFPVIVRLPLYAAIKAGERPSPTPPHPIPSRPSPASQSRPWELARF